MLVGDPVVFAVESHMTEAYERLSLRALGFFVIHVCGFCYGMRSPDATMLACSFDEVKRRAAMRGSHTVPFADKDAGYIAHSFRHAMYAGQEESYFGIPRAEFTDMFYSKKIVWAPDGDEAFDDGSCVLQFDLPLDFVRLIAFKSASDRPYDPATLRDVRLDSDDYYGILENWHAAFESEWKSLIKSNPPMG